MLQQPREGKTWQEHMDQAGWDEFSANGFIRTFDGNC